MYPWCILPFIPLFYAACYKSKLTNVLTVTHVSSLLQGLVLCRTRHVIPWGGHNDCQSLLCLDYPRGMAMLNWCKWLIEYPWTLTHLSTNLSRYWTTKTRCWTAKTMMLWYNLLHLKYAEFSSSDILSSDLRTLTPPGDLCLNYKLAVILCT